ncbi:MAG: ComEC/Rec2 family competence protein [Candidatus Pacebacteria bacterium]|nr:ComEC/Rec2 family competence protein [Candidatus Paceibacterota bacterium]
MTERLLAWGAVGWVSGILCRSLFVWGWQMTLFIFLLSIVMLLSWVTHRAAVYGHLGVVLLCFALGVFRVASAPHELPVVFVPLVDTNVSLHGEVIRDPDVRETTQRVQVEIKREGEHTRVLTVLPRYPRLSIGDQVTVEGKLTLPEAFATDGGRSFDYPHFLARDGVFAVIERGTSVLESRNNSLSVLMFRALYNVRHAFEEGVARALPEPAGALALGLVAGGKQGLGKALLDAFTVAGLLPIVVLSGYNVMIVAEAILRGFRFMPKQLATLAAVITILLFVVASGGGSSAVRAGIMAGIGLFARATGRTYHALRILIIVLVLMLISNPLLLVYDPGFQFSFVATLGLIVASPLVVSRILFIKNELLRETVATTIAAQVFVLPLLLYETGNLSLVALPANLLVLPIIPLTMLLSFIAGLVGVLVPAVASLVGLPAYICLTYIIVIAETLAALPLASATVASFSFGFVIASYVLLAVVIQHVKRNCPAHVGRGAVTNTVQFR